MEIIKLGSTSCDVIPLQNLLTGLGFYQKKIDGIYGSYTEKAVMAYQESKSLKKDGVMGPITWKSFDDPLNPYIPYMIKAGDTLHEISKKYLTTINRIILANPETDLETLFPNQMIIIPLKHSPSQYFKKDNTRFIENVENNIICELPLISVLLPVYNHEQYIQQTIESIQNQSYTNWELLIIDDGSTDQTPSILKEYVYDPRIHIYHQPNQRLPRALTHLHTLARGQFITWISSDNYMSVTMLEELFKYFILYPDTSMVYGDPALIDEKGDLMYENGFRDQNRDNEKPYILRLPQDTESFGCEFDNYINSCFLYKKEDATALGGYYYDDLNGMEDFDFWLRLHKNGKIRHVNNKEPLYFYRVHDASMSNKIQEKHLADYEKQAEMLLFLDKMHEVYCSKPWSIKMSKKARIYLKSRAKAYDILNKKTQTKKDKYIHFICSDEKIELKNGDCFVKLNNDQFQLYKYKNYAYQLITHIDFGNEVNPLAMKARYTHVDIPFWQFPLSFRKKIIGIHLPLAYIDVSRTIELMKLYQDYFFIIADTSDIPNELTINLIREAIPNCGFVGSKKVGEDYWMYSGCDCMLIPPLLESYESNYSNLFNECYLLAWAVGKWIMVPSGYYKENSLPYIYPYEANLYLPDITKLANPIIHTDVLNRYLKCYSYKGRLQKLFSLCNLATQDEAVKRPAFTHQTFAKDVLPSRIPTYPKDISINGWVGLCVDHLNNNESTQFVKFLAKQLRNKGIQLKFLCTESGGDIERELAANDFEITIYKGDLTQFRKDIRNDPPIIVNTHDMRNLYFLDIIQDLHIPMIDSIQSMYLYYTQDHWEKEIRRSRYFNHFISASSYAKTYYLMKNNAISEDQVDVIENAANLSHCKGLYRPFTRSLLNISDQDFVFISSAPIKGSKNLLGIMTAYDYFYSNINSQSQLILFGNVTDRNYYYEMLAYKERLSSKNNILILPDVHNCIDIGSLYQASDVFVLNSYFESFSMPAIEGLYSGLPIIHSDCGVGPKLYHQGSLGYLIPNPLGDPFSSCVSSLLESMESKHPYNTTELITAMKNMWENRLDWFEKKGQIKSQSLIKFNADKMVSKYLEIFKKVLHIE